MSRSSHEAFYSHGIIGHRAFFILGDSAWAVVDWLTGAGRLKLTNLIHLFPTLEVELCSDRAVARSRALSITIYPLGFALDSSDPVLRTWRGPGTQNQGLYSPDFGVKFPSAVVAVSSNRIDLPWIGGYVIARGSEQSLVSLEANPTEGRLSLELSGKTHRLQIS